jgi:competence protein ComGC
MNKVVYIMSLNQKTYCKGFSIVELLVSIIILLIIFPMIYNNLISTQQLSEKSYQEDIFKLESDIIFQNLSKDLKETIAIFDEETLNINYFKNSYLKNISNKITFASLNSVGNALLLIKFYNKELFNNKEIRTYKMVCYYPEINNSNLLLKRLESNEKFYNYNEFSNKEIEESNKFFFELPLNIYKSKLPLNINNITFSEKVLSKNIVKTNFNYNGKIYEIGGFEIYSSYKKFYINIYMYNKKLFKKFNYVLDIV